MNVANDTFDATITFTCSSCDDSDVPVTKCHLVDDAGKQKDLTELNCKLVHEALRNDLGYEGLNRIAQRLSLPPMSSETFRRYANFLHD